MNKSILVSLAILTLSTSVALAAQRTHHSRAMKHSHAVKPNASAAATNPTGVGPSPVGWGGVSSGDRDMYARNQHDSGLDKKK